MVEMFLRYNVSTEIDFFMPDDSDPWSGKTGLTSITVQFKKQGQSAFTTLGSPTITEIGNGWYKLSVPETLVDTYGFLVIRFSATGAKTQQQQYQVVAFNPYDSNLGLANLDVAVSSRLPNGNVTVGGYASGQDPASLVWDYSSRTLTSFGTLVSDIWSHSSRTLTSFGTLVADIWDYSTRTLTSFGTLVDDVASAVWSHTSRTLTDFGTLVSDVASAVWSHSTRTLTSFGSLVADIWGHSTRTLTSFGTLVSDVAAAVWAYVVEGGQSALSWMRLVGAALFGKLNRSGSNYAFRDWADTKNRIAGTVDDAGNRSITNRDGS